MVDDHGRKGLCGVEETIVHHEDADASRSDPRVEKLVEGAKHDLLGLLPGLVHVSLA